MATLNPPQHSASSALAEAGLPARGGVFDDALGRITAALSRDGGSMDLLCGKSPGFAAFLFSLLRQRLDRLFVVVTPDLASAEDVCDALNRFDDGAARHEDMPPAVLIHPGDVSPYQEISANRFLVMERIAGLFRIHMGLGVRYAVTPIDALARRTMPPEALDALTVPVAAGDEFDRDELVEILATTGYTRVPLVEDPGTYAVRGQIVDVFSPLYTRPVRIEWDADLVERIDTFDPDTQRAEAPVDAFFAVPASELCLRPSDVDRAAERIRAQAARLRIPTAVASRVVQDLRAGVLPVGAEAWLPAFHDHLALLCDWLPPDAVWIHWRAREAHQRIEPAWKELEVAHERALDRGRRIVWPPAHYAASPDELEELLDRRPRLRLDDVAVAQPTAQSLPVEGHEGLRTQLRALWGQPDALRPLVDAVRTWRGAGLSVVVTAHTPGSARRIASMLKSYGLSARVHEEAPRLRALTEVQAHGDQVDVFVGEVGEGFVFAPALLVVLDESDILVRPRAARRVPTRRSVLPELAIRSFQELQPGDFVVHVEHGIARYEGLVRRTWGGHTAEFLHLRFRDDASLYLPVYAVDRVHRFSGADAEAPVLSKLGGTGWERVRKRVRRDLLEMATELVALHAAREAVGAAKMSPPDEAYREFEATFPYEETPDQERVIEEVLEDLQRDRPMDRLVCGDVGFGKTEVAVRAAFKAVEDGYQVAVMVPTTVLAEQHRMTFERRFEGTPIVVETLSRAQTSAEQREVLARLRQGAIDVVIGTHRLLQRDVEFHNLGLVVIDEEQRFGVRHKEKLKALRTQAHVLALTATPIPRTLHMAMLGLRDLSIIATPPPDRLAVHTVVHRQTDDVVVEAIERELGRGGQVFLVHNRVNTIDRRAEMIRKLVPRARVAVGHGQMAAGELARVMRSFVDGEVDVLVCTTIIESGLDVPNANTLIVERADRFGLADLYQLRGRVGRSHVRAYAYFLIPDPRKLDGAAARRIAALQQHADLASGFHLATHDLEIRGAGNLLGKQQHGQIQAVGYDLYVEMLQEAIAEIRGQDVEKALPTEVSLPLDAYLPEEYCPDTGIRLAFYKRLASANDADELDRAHDDLVDRLGPLPEPAANLVELARLRLHARRVGLHKVELGHGLVFRVHPEATIPPVAYVEFVNRRGSRWKLTPALDALVRTVSDKERARPIDTAREALQELTHFLQARGLLGDLRPNEEA